MPQPPPSQRKDPWWLGGIDLPVINVGTVAEPIHKHGLVEEPPRPRWSVKVDLFPLSLHTNVLADWELVVPPKRTIYLSRIPIPGDSEYTDEVRKPRVKVSETKPFPRAHPVAATVCPANKAGRACGKICCNARAGFGLVEALASPVLDETPTETHVARVSRLLAQAAEATAKAKERAARNYAAKQASESSGYYTYRSEVPAGFDFHQPAPAPLKARSGPVEIKPRERLVVIGPRLRRPCAHKLSRTYSRRRGVPARRAARLALSKIRELRSRYYNSAVLAARVARRHFALRATRPTDPRLLRPGDFGCPASLFFHMSEEGQKLLDDALLSEWGVPPRPPVSSGAPLEVPPHVWNPAGGEPNIGALSHNFFANSPQHHAILNGHLADYKKDVARCRMTTPFQVSPPLIGRLPEFGLEIPSLPPPAHPHGFNKNLELRGLRLATQGLADGSYDLICAKTSKLNHLPVPHSVQNPIFEAKDLYRFRDRWDENLVIQKDNVVWHDIASVVGPKELAARLASSPARFMTVTGVNPPELMERAPSYDPELYSLEYVGSDCIWRPEGTDHGHYTQPISVTKEWFTTSLVYMPDGSTIHVELLDFAAGHCVWFLTKVDCPASQVLTFSRRNFIKVPALIGGGFTPGQRTIPLGLLESMVRFAQRTPDLSWRNLQAKGSQVAATLKPSPSPLQIDVAVHAANYVVGASASSWFQKAMARLSNILALRYTTSDEGLLNLRSENLVVHRFGKSYRRPISWGLSNAWTAARDARSPTAALALINAIVGCWVVPKVIFSEFLIHTVNHFGSLWNAVVTLYGWLDLQWWRVGVIGFGVAATSMLPSGAVKYISAAMNAMAEQLALYDVLGLLGSFYGRLFGLGTSVFHTGYCFTYQAFLSFCALALLFPGAFVWWEEPWMIPFALYGIITGTFPAWLLWRWLVVLAVCLAVDLYEFQCHWWPLVTAASRLVVTAGLHALSFLVLNQLINLTGQLLSRPVALQWLTCVLINVARTVVFGFQLMVAQQINGVFTMIDAAQVGLALSLTYAMPPDYWNWLLARLPCTLAWPLTIPLVLHQVEDWLAEDPASWFTLEPILSRRFRGALPVMLVPIPCPTDWLVDALLLFERPRFAAPQVPVLMLPSSDAGQVLLWLSTLPALSRVATATTLVSAELTAGLSNLAAEIADPLAAIVLAEPIVRSYTGCPPTPAAFQRSVDVPFFGTRTAPRPRPQATTPAPPAAFPTIMTMTPAAQVSPVSGLKMDPASYASFNAWVADLTLVYNSLPALKLPIGSSCFWQQVGVVTGCPAELWFFVYHAWKGSDPYAAAVGGGKVSESIMQTFCSYTGFGLVVQGQVLNQIGTIMTLAPRPAWPVLNLMLSTLPSGDRHVAHTVSLANVWGTGLATVNAVGWQQQVLMDTVMDDVANATAAQLTQLVALPDLNARLASIRYNTNTPFNIGMPLNATHLVQALTLRREGVNKAANPRGSMFTDQLLTVVPRPGNYGVVPGVSYLVGLPDIGETPKPLAPKSGLWLNRVSTYAKNVVSPPRKVDLSTRTDRGTVATRGFYQRPTPATERGPVTIKENAPQKSTTPLISRATKILSQCQQQYGRYVGVSLPRVPLAFETVSYTPDLDAAKELAADLKAHPSLLEMDDARTVVASLDAILKCAETPKPVDIRIAFGVPGSGKTTLCKQTIATFDPDRLEQTRIVSHNEFIRAQLRRDFTMLKRGYNFPTLRHIIAEPSSGDVFIDDGGKLWGAMLDLLILTQPLVDNWWVNGDPAQGREQIPLPMCQSKHRLSPVHSLAPLATRYATISHRVPHAVADAFGFYTTNANVGFLNVINAPLAGIPYITSSERYVSVLSQSGRTAYTFGSCQGLEFESAAVMDVSGLEQSVSDTNVLIAATRSRSGCHILTNFLWRTPLDPSPPTGSGILNCLLSGAALAGVPIIPRNGVAARAAFMALLHSVMPNLFADIGEAPAPGCLDRDTAYPSNIGSIVSAIQMEYPATVTSELADLTACDTKLGSAPLNDVLCPDPAVEGPHLWDPESREKVDAHGRRTAQFADDDRSYNPAFHSRYDRATEQLSLAKRIRVVHPGTNQAAYAAAHCDDLKRTFDQLWPECPKVSSESLAACAERVVDEYCSRRTDAQVMAKIHSQDPDQAPTDIKLFLKQQVIKKTEKMFSDAIPGQLIHEFPLSLTLTDAAVVLWIEENVLDAAPDNLVFLRRLTPRQIQERYRQQWNRERLCTGNDYTSWDQGCDATILALDRHILVRCGFSKEYIASYEYRKLNSRSFPGLLAVMQNSGDRFTWPFNSLRNAVVTICNLGYRSNVHYWFNGDDFVADDELKPTGQLKTQLQFVGKPTLGETAVFSGWIFGGQDCFYDSASLVYRLSIAEDRGTTGPYWQSAKDLLDLCDPSDPDYANASTILQRHLPHTPLLSSTEHL